MRILFYSEEVDKKTFYFIFWSIYLKFVSLNIKYSYISINSKHLKINLLENPGHSFVLHLDIANNLS